MQHDVLTLSDFYSDRGYAFVNVDPRPSSIRRRATVNVIYNDQPGPRSAGRSHQYQRQHQDLGQGHPARDCRSRSRSPTRTEDSSNSKRRLDRARLLLEHAHHDFAGDAARQDRSRCQRCRSKHRVVANRRRIRQLEFGVRKLQRWATTNLFGGGEAVSASAQIGFLFQNYNFELHRALVPRHSARCRACRSSTTRPYLFSFHQTNGGGFDQYELSADRAGLQETRTVPLDDVTRGPGLSVRKRRDQRTRRNSPLSTSRATKAIG